jgi:diadenosine tetraphosphate (Ap4A) HIT family hydrolase
MGIFAGGFLLVFVVPFLKDTGGIVVNGFIATKMKQHGSTSAAITKSSIAIAAAAAASTATAIVAMRSTQENRSADTATTTTTTTTDAPDEEIPNGNTYFGFYRPSNLSDFEAFGYGSNPTVFGQILRGELKTRFLVETDHLVAFEDIRPRAPFHGLVIPKTLVPSVFELHPTTQLEIENSNSNNKINGIASLSLLKEMSETAKALVRDNHPKAYEKGDYLLCFHIPPFNSVDHLHLHVLAPASSMAWLYRSGKYNTGTATASTTASMTTIKMGQPGKINGKVASNFSVRWCTSLNDIMSRLEKGSPATPYQRDDSWATIFSETVSSIAAILVSSSKSKSDVDVDSDGSK